jgi:hypothetical protein
VRAIALIYSAQTVQLLEQSPASTLGLASAFVARRRLRTA